METLFWGNYNKIANSIFTTLEWVETNLCRVKYLCVSDIIDIYNRCWNSDELKVNIVKEYKISPTIVSSIKNGTMWKDITDDLKLLNNN